LLPGILFPDAAGTARRMVMWLESPGNALLSLADRLGLDDEMMAVINWMYRRRPKPWGEMRLVAGVDRMLARLHGRYRMAVVSSRDESGTQAFLERFNLTRYFDAVVTGLSAEHTKPYPDPIFLAARRMSVEPAQCLMIGDTTVDMHAGRAAGAQTVGVLCGFGEEPELRRLGADEIVRSTADVADLLLGGRGETGAR
jgi:HAD superfamily hydrolase (TIGR01509 family)